MEMRLTRWVCLASVLFVLALAGCGAGAGTTGPATAGTSNGTAPGSGAAPAKALVRVTLGKAVDTVGFSAADVAQQEGFFKRNGVDVTIEVMGNSTVANSALTSGQIQFTMASASALLLARSNGLPLIAVAQEDSGTPLQLVVSKRILDKVKPGASLKERVGALDGAIGGITGPTDQGAYQLLFQALGVSPHVQFVRLGNQPAEVAALDKGEIDAFFSSPPSVFQAAAGSNGGGILVDGQEVPGWSQAAYDLTMTTSSYAKAHPDLVRAVAQAIAAADDFIRAHPNQTLDIEAAHFHGVSRSDLAKSLKIVRFAQGGQMTAAQWADALKIAIAEKFAKPGTQVQEGVDWTNTYLSGGAA